MERSTIICYILKCILFGLLNPLWFFFSCAFEFHTHLHPFGLTHFTFFHTFVCSTLLIEPVTYETKEASLLLLLHLHLVILFGVGVLSSAALKEAKLKAQKLNHVILGFFVMLLSVWTLFGSIIAIGFRYKVPVFGFMYFLALCSLLASWFLLCNVWSDLYLTLPPKDQPFFGIKGYVVLLGLLHLSISISSFFLTKFWPLCCLLLFASFVFSCNLWSCFFTKSYILCEHRRHEWDMLESPIDGVICHVAVRRNLRKMEDRTKLSIGFQFDDVLDINGLQYTVLESHRVSHRDH
ncbi:unnamed protein product [Caenorhabditis nigoni]